MESHTIVDQSTMECPQGQDLLQQCISHKLQGHGLPTELHDHVPEHVTGHVRPASLTSPLTSTASTRGQPLNQAVTEQQ